MVVVVVVADTRTMQKHKHAQNTAVNVNELINILFMEVSLNLYILALYL